MCGIYGLLSRDPARRVDPLVLRGMGESIVHRGPDGGGVHEAPGFGMGMRRLSIIDLATGDQPMANEDRSLWVVFNGEIYNYRELRAELSGRGHRFRTTSDTEVLVHLYEQVGEACVRRLRGMFAFAVWDGARHTLFLARDRLGVKPLYYADTPRGFVFGSEMKCLQQSGWTGHALDPFALTAYLRVGYVPDPASILDGVMKLPPAHTLTVRDGRAGSPRRYWQATAFFGRATSMSAEEAGEELWARLQSAVRSHLVSEVPVGAFLSGGVDSSAVLAIMAREAGARVKTFSVGFEEPGYNELPYAREVAQAFGADHHELLAGPDDLKCLEDLLAGLDEPFADASAIPTYLVARLARPHVKVVLSGDGGDELFAGYTRYLVDARRRRLGAAARAGFGGALRGLSRALPEGAPGKNYLRNISLPPMERYLDGLTMFSPDALRRLLDPAVAEACAPLFPDYLAASEGLDPLSRLQDLDLQTYLPGDILTKVDRMTMLHSLEARVPLLDHPLVEFACALPAGLQLKNGETKSLLKRVLGGRVPPSVLRRPKQGFAVPLGSWFSRRLPGFFREQLAEADELREAGLRLPVVRQLVDLYAGGRREDHCLRLWALVVLARSLRRLSERTA